MATTAYITAVRNLFNGLEVTGDPRYELPTDRGAMSDTMSTVTPQPLPPMKRGSELVQGEVVPFWTGAEDPRNKDSEHVVIDQFLRRPATLSVRDVRDCAVPWSMEVVGKHSRNVQHVRILCDQDATVDVLNLPYEIERLDRTGSHEQLGWGEHHGIDFLAFYAVKDQVVRLLHRQTFADYVLQQQQQGVQYRKVQREIPRDPYKRVANGLLIPISELDDSNIIAETWYITADE